MQQAKVTPKFLKLWLSEALEHMTNNISPMILLTGGTYKGHVDILAPTVQELAALEKEVQTSFLHLGYLPNQLFRTFWLCLRWELG